VLLWCTCSLVVTGTDRMADLIKSSYRSYFSAFFLSEHIYLVVRLLVRTAISKLDSAAMRKERSERFMVRRKYLEESGLGHAVQPLASPPNSPLKTESGEQAFASITRQSLEDDARNQTLSTTKTAETVRERFWLRQRSWADSEKFGLNMIDLMDLGTNKSKKAQ